MMTSLKLLSAIIVFVGKQNFHLRSDKLSKMLKSAFRNMYLSDIILFVIIFSLLFKDFGISTGKMFKKFSNIQQKSLNLTITEILIPKETIL